MWGPAAALSGHGAVRRGWGRARPRGAAGKDGTAARRESRLRERGGVQAGLTGAEGAAGRGRAPEL